MSNLSPKQAEQVLRKIPANLPVENFDPAKCRHPADNRPVDDRGELLENMREHGQIEPGMVADHPEEKGALLCINGNGRLACCRILGNPFKAVKLPFIPTPAEVITFRLTVECLRKPLTPLQIADDLARLCELTGWTQEVAAKKHGCSQGNICRLLQRKFYSPELKKLVDTFQIVPSAADAIFKLGDPALEAQAIQYALSTPKPSRDKIKAYCDNLRGKKPAKPKALKGKDGKRRFTIDLLPGDTHDGLIESLKGIIARIGKAQKDGIDVRHLGVLFQGGAG